MKIIQNSQTQYRALDRGFTLIEMLIYIGLMSLIMVLVLGQSLDVVNLSNRINDYVYANRL